MGEYPDNRLRIRIDGSGKVSFEQDADFARYYKPTREDIEEEIEELRDELAELELNEPMDALDGPYSDWEEEKEELENRIEELESILEDR